jgi:hypothetical protein
MSFIFQFMNERDHYKKLYQEATGIKETASEARSLLLQELQREKNKDLDALINPLSAPLRKNVLLQEPVHSVSYDRSINIPTQGDYTTWHQVGILRQKVVTDSEQMMPIIGRRIDRHRWEYYTTNHLNTSLKIPLDQKSNEFYDGDELEIPGYTGLFVVEIYDYDKPRYIPLV